MSPVTDTELETRFTYHPPKSEQVELYHELRQTARIFAAQIITCTPESREQSLALTALEEAVMWANAAIARRS